MARNLSDIIYVKDIDTIYEFIVKFIPEDEPTEDEIKAIREANADTSSTISHEDINWK